jgi:hypothetical protein
MAFAALWLLLAAGPFIGDRAPSLEGPLPTGNPPPSRGWLPE